MVESFGVLVTRVNSPALPLHVHKHAVPTWGQGAPLRVTARRRVLYPTEALPPATRCDTGDVSHTRIMSPGCSGGMGSAP